MRHHTSSLPLTFTKFKGATGKTLMVCSALAGMSSMAQANPYTWAGGSNAWATTTAWTPNATPGASDDITFSAAPAATVNLNDGAHSVNSITVAGTQTGAVTFSQTSTPGFNRDLFIGGGGITIGSGAGAVTIGNTTTNGVNANLSATQTWTNNSSNTLTLDNIVRNASGNTAPVTLTIAGSGNTSFVSTGAITDGVTAGGATALSIGGTGTTTIASTANTYSGGTTISSGTTVAYVNNTSGTITAANFGTGAVTITGGKVSIGNLASSSAFITYGNAFTLNGTGTLVAQDGIVHLSNTLNIGSGGGTIGSLFDNTASTSRKGIFVDGALTGTGTLTVSYLGTGTGTSDGSIARFTNTGSASVNTFTGTVLINANPTATGGGTYALLDGTTTAFSNATVDLNGTNAGGVFGSSGLVYNFPNATNVALGGLMGNGALVLTGVNGTSSIGLTIGGGSTNATTSFTGAISGGGSITKTGTGTLTLGGTDSYSGATSVNNGSLVVNGTATGTGSYGANTTGTLTLASSGTITGSTLGATDTAVVNLNSGTYSGSALSANSTGVVNIAGGNYIGTTLSTSNSGVVNLSSGSFSGTTISVSGTSALNVSGGTMTGTTIGLTNTGAITVSGGTLNGTTLTYNNAGSTVNLNGGTLALTGNIASGTGSAVLNFNGGTLKNANTGSTTMTIASGVASFNILSGGGTIDTTGGSITSSATIGSATSTGTLTVQGGHTLTTALGAMGGTTLTGAGTTLVDSSATTNTALLTVGTGAIFDMDGSNQSVGGLAGAGSVINSGTAGKTLTLNGTGTSTFSGVYSGGTTATTAGTGALTIASGTEILSGANLFTGATTVNNGATLQLQNTSAIAASALNLNSGSTLALRANTASNGTTTTFTAASINPSAGGGTYNFDVNNLGSGTGGTIALPGTITFGNNTSNQLNITGGNGMTLALGQLTNVGSSSGTYNFTINATTAGVSTTSFLASSWGTNLILQGGNNITFGSSSTAATTTTLSSNSNGYFNTSVNGAIVTIYGNYSTPGSGQHTLALNSGQLNFNSINASGGIGFAINGGTLDNTSGGALTETGNDSINIAGNFAFGGSNALNMGTGAVTLTGNNTATINGSTLTLAGGFNMAGNTFTRAGAGTLALGSVIFTGAGNKLVNTGTGTLSLGGINNGNGYSIDFTTTGGGAITTTSTNGNPTNLNLFLSTFDTVNNGADFAAVNGSGVIVARNSIASEVAFTGSGGTSGNVYTLSGNLTASGTQTLGSLIINDTGTGHTLTIGTSNLTLGGQGNGGILYNGGATGSYTIASTGGLLTGGSGHSFNINTYAGTLTISAQILNGAGSSFDTLQKGGAGTLILTGANSFGGTSGGINLGGGTLDLGNGNTGTYLGTIGTINIQGNSTLGIGLANGSTVGAPINDNSGAIVGIENSGVTNTLSGTISGGGNIVQNGLGTTIISGSGATGGFFTGAVNINAGAIQITNAGAFGATVSNHMTSGVTVASGAALQIATGISTTGAYALTINGAGVTGVANGALEGVSGANTYTGAITLASNAAIGADSGASLTASGAIANGGNVLSLTGAGNTTVSGVVSGTGGLTASGTGTETISGTAANTYTGPTVVSSGELDLNKSASVIAIQGAGVNDVVNSPDISVKGGTLKFLANDQMANSKDGTGNVTLSLSSGTVNLNGTTQTLYAFQNTGGTFTTGSGGDLIGTGATITFAGGTNTISANSTVEDNHFVISGGTNTVQGGSVAGTLQLDGFGAGIVLSNGANLTLNSDATAAGQISFKANFGAAYDISSLASSTTASITSGGSAAHAGTIKLNGQTAVIDTALGTVANGGPDLLISAAITSTGTGKVTKNDSGTLALSGANTYTGVTSINGGTLDFINAASLYNSTGGNVTSTSAGNVVVASGATMALGVGNSSTYFNSADVTTVLTQSTFASGANIGFDTTNAGGNFTYSSDTGNSGGNLGLVKLGSGTLTLSNATGNTYTGPTVIKQGAVLVTNTSGSGTGSGAVTVSGSGVMLGGTGIVGGPVTVSSGGSLYSGAVSSGAPATGVGTGMTLTSTLNVNGGNLTFALNTGGTTDFTNPNKTTSYLSTNGVVSFTGTDSITLVDLTNGKLTLRQNSAYLLISSSLGNAGFSGLVTSDASGHLSLDGNGYVVGVYVSGSNGSYVYNPITINQLGSDGVTSLTSAATYGKDQSYITPELVLYNGDLEIVPEPSTWAMMLCGLGVLLFWQRRRQRNL